MNQICKFTLRFFALLSLPLLAIGEQQNRFIKLDNKGQALKHQDRSYQDQPWACVKDTNTGLIWEVKTPENKHEEFTWYSSNKNINGGLAGNPNGRECVKGKDCNTEKYLQSFLQNPNNKRFCGNNNWRIPNHLELLSLADHSKIAPAIDSVYFPNTAPARYWSSTPFAGEIISAWEVHFQHGVLDYGHKEWGRRLRLVSSAKLSDKVNDGTPPFQNLRGCKQNILRSNPNSKYRNNQDGTISDLASGLTWQQCTLGSFGDQCQQGEAKKLSWSEAIQEANNYQSEGWRLPKLRELSTLLDGACFSPAINSTFFPNTKEYYYWSQDQYQAYSWLAWSIHFRSGVSYFSLKNYERYSRLVKDTEQR